MKGMSSLDRSIFFFFRVVELIFFKILIFGVPVWIQYCQTKYYSALLYGFFSITPTVFFKIQEQKKEAINKVGSIEWYESNKQTRDVGNCWTTFT